MDYHSKPGEKRYVLVELSLLPEVFARVLQVKALLESGAVRSISNAVRQVGISRSAYYKYKDSVFPARDDRRLHTLQAVLVNNTGTLQALLAKLSHAGADVVTIHQQKPQGDYAQVTLTVNTDSMHKSIHELLAELEAEPFVKGIEMLEE